MYAVEIKPVGLSGVLTAVVLVSVVGTIRKAVTEAVLRDTSIRSSWTQSLTDKTG